MRIEIKFRAWLPTEGKMTRAHTLKEIVDICSFGYPDNAIWLQYIGRKNIHGMEVYEGDVLQPSISNEAFDLGEEDRAVVYYDEKYARFGLSFHSIFGGEGYTGKEQDISDYMDNYKIGNIYQTPELLK